MRGRKSLIVFDRTGYYTAFVEQNRENHLLEQDVFLACFSTFWLRAMKVSQSIAKGHLWYGISQFSVLRDQMFILARLTKGKLSPWLHLARSSKGIERDLEQGEAESLSNSLCDYSYSSVTEALTFCIEWFLRETEEYAKKRGGNYDHQLQVARIASAVTRDLLSKRA
jgi:hypothetical protein